MVTRRAVLKGTAAASIGAIAAAHGATPVEAAGLECGFGNLAGGAVAGFYKEKTGFNASIKFHKASIDIFIKQLETGGVAIFSKFFHKHWSPLETQELDARTFPDLKFAEISFLKIEQDNAQLFLKTELGSAVGDISFEADKMFYKWREVGKEGEVELPPGPIKIEEKG